MEEQLSILGLLTPMREAKVNDIAAFEEALKWCRENGAQCLQDVVFEAHLFEQFVGALKLKPVQEHRLKAAIKPQPQSASASNKPTPVSGAACDLFCSYKQNDGSDSIASTLFYELKEKQLHMWLDKKMGELRSEEGMLEGVRACRVFLMLISPEYFNSHWCFKELSEAMMCGKQIIICYNGSKFKVAEALQWIPTIEQLRESDCIQMPEDSEYLVVGLKQLRQAEFIQMQEDIEYFQVGLNKLIKRVGGNS